MMNKALGKTLFGAAVLLASAVAASNAQNAGDQEKGSTGWSGGSKDQPSQSAKGTQGDPVTTTGQKVEEHDEGEAKKQPEVATGEDLKGPPQQFAPSNTPE
jgi:hypothetical protein